MEVKNSVVYLHRSSWHHPIQPQERERERENKIQSEIWLNSDSKLKLKHRQISGGEVERVDVVPTGQMSVFLPCTSSCITLSLPLTGKASFPEADLNQSHRGRSTEPVFQTTLTVAWATHIQEQGGRTPVLPEFISNGNHPMVYEYLNCSIWCVIVY